MTTGLIIILIMTSFYVGVMTLLWIGVKRSRTFMFEQFMIAWRDNTYQVSDVFNFIGDPQANDVLQVTFPIGKNTGMVQIAASGHLLSEISWINSSDTHSVSRATVKRLEEYTTQIATMYKLAQ